MIGHEAVGQYPQAVASGVFREKVQVSAPQAIRREDVLPGIAALGDVMRNADGYNPTFARHVELVRFGGRLSQS